MRHMVMMKLQPGAYDDQADADYRETFRALQAALPEEILSVQVLRNCVPRAPNMDVLIEMRLRSPESLPIYLHHPLHVAIGERYNPKVVRIASFDTEEETAP